MVSIRNIYAGKPDARDEIRSEDEAKDFFDSLVIPEYLPYDDLLTGRKCLITGYKGVGKTAFLFYLADKVKKKTNHACTSFVYFKTEFEELRRSQLNSIGQQLTSIVDIRGEIQSNKVEYVQLWRWYFFNRIADDCEEYSNGLFEQGVEWDRFVSKVREVKFNSTDKRVLSLDSLSVRVETPLPMGAKAEIEAKFEPVSRNDKALRKFIDITGECEACFEKIKPIEDTPYYISLMSWKLSMVTKTFLLGISH